MRKINAAGLELVKSFEGLRLKAYKDAVGVLTIGWGSTGAHVKPGMTITLEEAEALLRSDLSRFERGVDELLGTASSNQFSACCSLAYNIGLAAFARSTVLKRHKLGNSLGAANAFLMWNKAGGRVLNGLVRRREAERRLYLTPDAVVAPVEPVKPAETPVEAPLVAEAPQPVPVAPTVEPAPLGCLAAVLGMFRK